MDFLDITISYDSIHTQFNTSIFQKILNKYLYLSPRSCHAPHIFKGFIKGELTRYARLSSNAYSYRIIKCLFYQRLVNRGYSRRFLDPIFHGHTWISREHALRPRYRVLLPFVIPYSLRSGHKQLEGIFKNSIHDFKDFFNFSELLLVYSRTSNVCDILTSSALSDDQSLQLSEKKIATRTIWTPAARSITPEGPPPSLAAQDNLWFGFFYV